MAQEVELRFVSNVKEAVGGISRVRDEMEDLSDAITEANDNNKALFESKNSGNLQKSFTEQIKLLAQYEKQGIALQKQLNKTFDTKEVKEIEDALVDVGAEILAVTKSIENFEFSESIEGQKGELEDAARALRTLGLEGTDTYKSLIKEAGDLQRSINDVTAEIDYQAGRTSTLEGLVGVAQSIAGGFAIAEGAAALFGEESEDVQQALLKVNAAMSILNGLQSINEALTKRGNAQILVQNTLSKARNALTRLFTAEQTAATVATNAQSAAQRALGISSAAAASGIRAVRIALLGIVGGAIVAGIAAIVLAIKKLNAENEERLRLQGLVNDANAEGIKNAVAEKNELEKLLLVARDENQSKQTREAAIRQINQISPEYLGNLRLETISTDESTAAIGRYIDALNRKSRAQALDQAIVEKNKELIDAETQSVEEEIGLFDKIVEGVTRGTTRASARAKARIAEDVAEVRKEIDVLEKAREALIKQDATTVVGDNLSRSSGVNQPTSRTPSQQGRVASEKKTNDALLALRKRLLEEQKALEEKYLDEIARTSGPQAVIERQRDKDLAEINERVRGLQELKAQVALGRKEVSEAELNALVEAGDKRIALSKEQEELFNSQRAQIISQSIKDIEKLNFEEQVKLLDAQRDFAKSKIALEQSIADDTQTNQENAQRKRLEADIDYFEKKLQLYATLGGDITETEINQTKAQINNLRKELATIGKKEGDAVPKGNNILTQLGFEVTDEQFQSIKDKARQLAEIVTNAYSESIQRNIDENQNVINSINDRIEAQRSAVDEEIRLAEAGNQANVAAERDKLRKLEAEKRKAVEKQKELQKQQLNLDAAAQASSLITASANILKGFSALPVAGQILAIAAIAAMFASFASAQSQAREAINAQQFGQGGVIDGKPHSQGGVKYYSNSSSNVKELEGGEWVINKASSAKYHDLLNAINADRLKLQPTTFNLPTSTHTNYRGNDKRLINEVKEFRKDLKSKKDIIIAGNRVIETKGNYTKTITYSYG